MNYPSTQGFRRHITVAMVAAVTVSLSAAVGQAPPGSAPGDQETARLAEANKIISMQKQKDVAGLEAEIPRIERVWGKVPGDAYPSLIAGACVYLQNAGPLSRSGEDLIQQAALAALRRGAPQNPGISIHLLMELAYPENDPAWPALRKEQALMWVHAAIRIKKLVADKPDRKDWPVISPYRGQMNDKEWHAFLEQNARNAKRVDEYANALETEKLARTWMPVAMQGMYSRPPYAMDELRDMLKQAEVDPVTSARIVANVQSKIDRKATHP